MSGNQMLKKQLELARFEKTMEYVSTNAHSQKHLNSTELAQINNMLTGNSGDPWRTQSVSVKLPSGNEEHFAVVTNPMIRARDIIFQARDEAFQGDIVKAAANLYAELVLAHLFKDANRRTAVAATCWLLYEKGISMPSLGFLELGVGNLRDPEQMNALKGLIKHTIDVARNRANT